LGAVDAEVVKPIRRCVATHVDPQTGERDLDIVRALFDTYGHMHCGIYARVLRSGRVSRGDPALLDVAAPGP
jgi:hypothetical protein